MDDYQRNGRPKKVDDDALVELISLQQSINVEEMSEELDVFSQTIRNHLHNLNYVVKLNKWVPHQLSSFNKYNRVRICKLLLNWWKKDFFPNMITCDEKWLYYDNNSRKYTWCTKDQTPGTVAKRGLTNRKVLMCCFWSIYGIELIEFLNSGQTRDMEGHWSR